MSTKLSLLPEVIRGIKSYNNRRAYHVAAPIPGPAVEAAAEIKRGESKSQKQDAEVLAFFRSVGGKWTPSQVWQLAFNVNLVPLTSVRRAMTNLTTAGELRCTTFRRTGLYGRPEHFWTLNEGVTR